MSALQGNLAVVGILTLGLGALHAVLPRALGWARDLAGASPLNREVSYVHCYFIGLSCLLWGLLALTSGRALLQPNPVARVVLLGAVAFWCSRLVIQLAVFNHHAEESRRWLALSVAGTLLWIYVAGVWAWALAMQL
jgi:hypothetical protein